MVRIVKQKRACYHALTDICWKPDDHEAENRICCLLGEIQDAVRHEYLHVTRSDCKTGWSFHKVEMEVTPGVLRGKPDRPSCTTCIILSHDKDVEVGLKCKESSIYREPHCDVILIQKMIGNASR